MESERNVLDDICEWAADSPLIRAIILVGSRADPRREPDRWSDYDIEVFVRDTGLFVNDTAWIDRFGSILVRLPTRPKPTVSPDWTTQLVQYDDGLRIDFQFTELTPDMSPSLDEGHRLIVDQDGFANQLPDEPPAGHTVTRPTEDEFRDRVNAFWWDILYVAKALRRGELNYAKYMLDGMIRFDIVKPLVEWYIGTTHGWDINTGVHGRWFKRYLDAPLWDHYRRTFAADGEEENWTAMEEMMRFVRRIGEPIAAALSCDYDSSTDERVTAYARAMRSDP